MVVRYDLNKHYSTIQENTIAKYLGWSVVSGSGARSGHPGDIKSEEWLGECKTHTKTDSKLFVSFNVWDKISDEAQSQFKKPALFVDDGSQQVENTFVLFRPTILNQISEIDLTIKDHSSFSKSLDELNALLQSCTYQFIVIKHGARKFAFMPLPIFKQYLGLC